MNALRGDEMANEVVRASRGFLKRRVRAGILLGAASWFFVVWAGHSLAQDGVARANAMQSAASREITRLAAGTVVEDPDAARWNAVVLLARPQIASGDVDALPATIRGTVASFVLTILATVQPYTDATTGTSKFRLKDVGVGYSMDVDGQLKVVTLQDYSKLGVRLGFFQRQMLSENEKQLSTVRVIAKTSTLTVFDTPALLFRRGAHRDFIIRHFIWIDANTGRNAALTWLLKSGPSGLQVVDEPFRWMPAGMKENRRIHVDGDEFMLGGIPTERAFALENLPPGKQVQWTTESKQLAARSGYDRDSLRQLTLALNEALQSVRSNAQSGAN